MNINQYKNENEKYIHDIETIKSLLLKIEEKSIFETWVFFVSGIFFLLGSLIHYLGIIMAQLTLAHAFLRIWLPVLIILLLLEPIALIKKMTKESIPILSPTIIKLYMGIIGLTIAAIFICVNIAEAGSIHILPATILSLWALAYFLYGQIAYSYMFLHGFVMILAAILLIYTRISIEIQFIIIGIILGLSMIIAGISEYRKNKKKNEK